jgi:hypothetical protein
MATQRVLKLGAAVILAAIVLTLATCHRYRATIVDAESGKPLPGAVLVVVWCRYYWLAMDHTYTFHAAEEAVTDSQGRVSITTWPAIDWDPLTRVAEPQIAISLVGYEPINEVARRSLPEDLLHGRTVELKPSPPGGEDHHCYASTPCANGEALLDACRAPRGSVPLLTASLEAQRELVKSMEAR